MLLLKKTHKSTSLGIKLKVKNQSLIIDFERKRTKKLEIIYNWYRSSMPEFTLTEIFKEQILKVKKWI